MEEYLQHLDFFRHYIIQDTKPDNDDIFILKHDITGEIIEEFVQVYEENYALTLQEVKENILKFIDDLVAVYKYKPLPKELSEKVRVLYARALPKGLKIDGDNNTIQDEWGVDVANGYKRIVIGDYGAYIEFDESQARTDNFIVAKGEEYRLTDSYRNSVKYIWYTTIDDGNCKIYHQTKTVSYADYKVGMYYISPYELFILG